MGGLAVSQKYQDKKVKKNYICCLCIKLVRKSNHLVPLLDVVRVKPGQGLVKVFDIEVHISPSTSLLFSVIIDITNSPYLSSSSSPMLLPSSTSPCILCQPAHLVLGELHHLRLPPLLVLLPVLLVHHHLELEISRELLNSSLKKLCPERS